MREVDISPQRASQMSVHGRVVELYKTCIRLCRMVTGTDIVYRCRGCWLVGTISEDKQESVSAGHPRQVRVDVLVDHDKRNPG